MKQKTVNTFFLTMGIILAAYMSVGCTETLADLSGGYEESEKEIIEDGQISFRTGDVDSAPGETRGARATAGSITEYGVSCAIYPTNGSYTAVGCGSYFFNERIDNSTGNCKYFWPGANYLTAFYGYYPYGNSNVTLQSSANSIGKPVYAYTAPTTIADHVDFMTAEVLNESGERHADPLLLTFGHRCSDIRFIVTNSTGDAITVNSVSMYGVKYSGTFNGSWTLNNTVNTSSSHTFTLAPNIVVADEGTGDITGTTNHFIIPPQTVNSGTEIFNFVIDNEPHEFVLESNATFEQGKSYTFNITMASNIEISIVTAITDWTEETTDPVSIEYPVSPTSSISNWIFTPAEEDPTPDPITPTSNNGTISDWTEQQ